MKGLAATDSAALGALIPVAVAWRHLRRRLATDQGREWPDASRESTFSLLLGEIVWIAGQPVRAVRRWRGDR